MNNKVALCAFADEADKMISNQIDALKGNNIKFLEIRGVDGTNIADITLDNARELKAKFDESGIKVWSIGSPIGKCNISDDFSIELTRFKHVLDVAEILGAENIRMFSFYGTNGAPEYEEKVIERLKEFVTLAKEKNITLCHENEKDIYGDISSRCHEILSEINSENFRAIFDFANFVQCKENTKECYELLKKNTTFFKKNL